MAEAIKQTYKSLEEAKAECQRQNEERVKAGAGKERFVFEISANGVHQFYVVATLSGKARAIAAMAMDIRASVAEKKTPFGGGVRKPLVDEVAAMSPDELAKLRSILTALDAPQVQQPTPVQPTVEPETEPTKRGRSKQA